MSILIQEDVVLRSDLLSRFIAADGFDLLAGNRER
jgi:hypothetical protein